MARCIDAALNGERLHGEAAWATKPARPCLPAEKEPHKRRDSVAHDYGGGRFEISLRGVFFIGTDKDGNELSPRWICSPCPWWR